jgi:hypothetical protein
MRKTIDNVTYLAPEFVPLRVEEKAFLEKAPLISNDNEFVSKARNKIIGLLYGALLEKGDEDVNGSYTQ